MGSDVSIVLDTLIIVRVTTPPLLLLPSSSLLLSLLPSFVVLSTPSTKRS
jgi:hypothetical protein